MEDTYQSEGQSMADREGAKRPENQSDTDKKEAARIAKRWERLDGAAALNWKTHWQDCYEFIVPRKEDVVATRLPGDRRDSDLYDTTAVLANEQLASALHGMLTNPEQRFFEISFGDPRLDELPAVKDWCQDTGDRMFRVLNSTNFQTEIYEVYLDLGAIGTACMYMGEHEENVVHFSARAMKEIRIDENSLGLIDVVYRCFKWRAFQLVQEFGEENCPYDVLRAYDKNSDDQFEVIHAVEPQDDRMLKKYKGHNYKSTYILKDSKFILSKGGFRECPYVVPRWTKTTGEIYGRGPGMHMLPDIMMVNAMMLTVISGAQKTVDPPLMVPDDGVIGNVRLTPGGLTIVRAGEQNNIKPLITDARIDFGQQMLQDVRTRIRSGFYVDQLKLPSNGPQMTAEEIQQRAEESYRLMGPVLGRQHFELLRPLITRLFDIMYRRALITPAPQTIQGKNFDVRYTSMIARAQRVSEGQNIARALSLIQPMIQVKPGMADVVDGDKIVRYLWDVYGNKHDLLVSERDLEKQRQAQQQHAQEMMQKQNEMHQAEVANKTAPMIQAVQQGSQTNAPRPQ